MTVLENKIDFEVIVDVNHANPNGNPLDGNRPREDYFGNGEISDVCIKRKIRNRLQMLGESIFVQSQDRADDGMKSLKERAEADEVLKQAMKSGNSDEFKKRACDKYFDVRAFGGVFAFKNTSGSSKGLSVGITGPVTIQIASSVAPVDIVEMQITKSVNSEQSKNGTEKGSDTMGTKYFVSHGLYVIKGSISPFAAERTGFTNEDAEKLREALKTMFEGDETAARPAGSMEVKKIIWNVHDSKSGSCSSGKVFRALHVNVKEGVDTPKSYNDYDISIDKIDGINTEVIDLD